MTTRISRLWVAPLLLSLLAAAPHLRHTALVKSEPAKDAVVAVAPTTLRLWFNEPVPLANTRVRLVREGRPIALDSAVRRTGGADTPVTIGIRGTLSAGAYTVQWATASKDGHPVQGSFGFTVAPRP